MKHIYIKDADGRKVIVEVTDEVAQAYRESLREEWRGDAKERYHTISLGAAVEHLTPLQRATLYKLYVLHMSQAEISREEGVIESVISRRISRLYARLKKFLEKD